ncbi:MAG: hypothetical protein J0M20_06580 [Burkholderiales bacterium]|nr:hypothetical protein [Burkholderiales bacterium]
MPRYAAIDIGSNSVRMLAADVDSHGNLNPLASDRQVTRLGESVFGQGVISEQAMTLVCGVLARMAQSYRKHDIKAVRAVATAAVRDASNQRMFLDRASEAIGSPVEIVSGQEEARLIHLGVQLRWPHPRSRVLIIDIGGGSAEIIVGGMIANVVSPASAAVANTSVAAPAMDFSLNTYYIVVSIQGAAQNPPQAHTVMLVQ